MAFESTAQNEKEEIWQRKAAEVDLITDRLGLEIDKGIKDTVIALQVFGINTTSSHEGKMERYPIPYIDVQAADIEELDNRLDALKPEQEAEAEEISNEILRRNLEERRKLIPLFEEFYKDRKVPYEICLNISPKARGWSRVQSQGADFQKIETDEEVKRQRLQQFQEEMKAFTEFLRSKFLIS